MLNPRLSTTGEHKTQRRRPMGRAGELYWQATADEASEQITRRVGFLSELRTLLYQCQCQYTHRLSIN
jgi:hypothetical protein